MQDPDPSKIGYFHEEVLSVYVPSLPYLAANLLPQVLPVLQSTFVRMDDFVTRPPKFRMITNV
jgi:hypothetical protein